MNGIMCQECRAIVTTEAAVARLISNSMLWLVNAAIQFGRTIRGGGASVEDKNAAGKTMSFNCMACSEEMNDDFLVSGFLAEQYNAQEYKCVNGHSGNWVNTN